MSFWLFIQMIIFGITLFYVASSRNSCFKLRHIAQEQEHYSEEFYTEHKELMKTVIYLEEEMKNLHHRMNHLSIPSNSYLKI